MTANAGGSPRSTRSRSTFADSAALAAGGPLPAGAPTGRVRHVGRDPDDLVGEAARSRHAAGRRRHRQAPGRAAGGVSSVGPLAEAGAAGARRRAPAAACQRGPRRVLGRPRQGPRRPWQPWQVASGNGAPCQGMALHDPLRVPVVPGMLRVSDWSRLSESNRRPTHYESTQETGPHRWVSWIVVAPQRERSRTGDLPDSGGRAVFGAIGAQIGTQAGTGDGRGDG